MPLGLLGLAACATTGPQALEIPIREALTQPCERLPIPAESELPALSQNPEAAAAQLEERRWWGQRDLAHEGVETRLCRQRDEAVAITGRYNQIVRENQ